MMYAKNSLKYFEIIDGLDQYKNYIYEKKEYFKHMPIELFQCLEKNLGWHLCISCKNKI
jgi:hypothetical protein